MASRVTRLLVRAFLERPAHRAGAAELEAALTGSLGALTARFATPRDPVKAAVVLRHIVGIERWGQRRLRVALGDVPFERDTYQGYAPDPAATLDGLVSALRATRQDTIVLARRLASEGSATVAVEHNGLGPLTALAWLRYLRLHADLEAKRIAPARP